VPVSNEVNIKVTSTDGTGPGFKSASAGAKKVGEDAEAAGQKASKFGESMRRTGEVAGGILAADLAKVAASKVADFFKSSTEAASSLGESMNAVSKVFGSGTAKINRFGGGLGQGRRPVPARVQRTRHDARRRAAQRRPVRRPDRRQDDRIDAAGRRHGVRVQHRRLDRPRGDPGRPARRGRPPWKGSASACPQRPCSNARWPTRARRPPPS
jgi:hypothetical protein